MNEEYEYASPFPEPPKLTQEEDELLRAQIEAWCQRHKLACVLLRVVRQDENTITFEPMK